MREGVGEGGVRGVRERERDEEEKEINDGLIIITNRRPSRSEQRTGWVFVSEEKY